MSALIARHRAELREAEKTARKLRHIAEHLGDDPDARAYAKAAAGARKRARTLKRLIRDVRRAEKNLRRTTKRRDGPGHD